MLLLPFFPTFAGPPLRPVIGGFRRPWTSCFRCPPEEHLTTSSLSLHFPSPTAGAHARRRSSPPSYPAHRASLSHFSATRYDFADPRPRRIFEFARIAVELSCLYGLPTSSARFRPWEALRPWRALIAESGSRTSQIFLEEKKSAEEYEEREKEVVVVEKAVRFSDGEAAKTTGKKTRSALRMDRKEKKFELCRISALVSENQLKVKRMPPMLLAHLSLLKVGGRMVYSTCFMNPIENEAVFAEAYGRLTAEKATRNPDRWPPDSHGTVVGKAVGGSSEKSLDGWWKVTSKVVGWSPEIYRSVAGSSPKCRQKRRLTATGAAGVVIKISLEVNVDVCWGSWWKFGGKTVQIAFGRVKSVV
ncbi:hypothetical protein L484_015296 [Morus notabilis]|uniref:SAM-dependent MTase RsmB/NOP-type domain-containing protein n=1 Tax=Morus notabilis TaxID=981085 RepID=W9RR14_9ROSA|nr:hypothetical protein L484_015296 [Morus notabilis]